MSDLFLRELNDEWHTHFGRLDLNNKLNHFRQDQFNAVATQELPTTKVESWKYTSLAPVKNHHFTFTKRPSIAKEQLQSHFLPEPHYRLVFVDGIFNDELTHLPPAAPGCLFTSLAVASEKHYDQFKHYLVDSVQGNFFAKLNKACIKEGVFLLIPKNFVVDLPVHILNIHSEAGATLHSLNNIIVLEPGAKVRIFEEHVAINSANYLTNVLTSLHVGEQAEVHYTKLQDQPIQSFHMGNIEINQRKDSRVEMYHLHLGGQLVRDDVYCHLNESGASISIQGNYMPLKKQHQDIHTYIYHNAENTTSEEFYKGIVAQKSKAVFNGQIKVASNIKQAIANLQNKNLLLTADSEVYTKPELEIYSDDVKCRHGATVGQLDQQMVFYLQSRGISQEIAYEMLVMAFVSDSLETLPYSAVAERVRRLVTTYCEGEYL